MASPTGDPSGPAASSPAPPAANIEPGAHVFAAAEGLSPAPLVLLSGASLVVHVAGRPRETALWEFGYAGLRLKNGDLTLDEAGSGRLQLALPQVRARAVCELLVTAGGGPWRRTVVVYPPAFLQDAAGRVRGCDIGVLDPTGRVQRALAAEGITCENLAPQIARDYFDGTIVVLAGQDRAEALDEMCRQFNSRVRGGMSVLVLNPPPPWSAWEIDRLEVQPPERTPARLAAGFGPFVPPEDLGDGPWKSMLRVRPGATVLAWCDAGTLPAAGAVAATPSGRRALLVEQAVGRGRVMVSVLPQTAGPDTDAVGRGLLAQMILGMIETPRGEAQPKENNHE